MDRTNDPYGRFGARAPAMPPPPAFMKLCLRQRFADFHRDEMATRCYARRVGLLAWDRNPKDLGSIAGFFCHTAGHGTPALRVRPVADGRGRRVARSHEHLLESTSVPGCHHRRGAARERSYDLHRSSTEAAVASVASCGRERGEAQVEAPHQLI